MKIGLVFLQIRKQGFGLSSHDNHQGKSGGSPYGSLNEGSSL